MPTGTVIGAPVSNSFGAANQTLGRVHRDGANSVFTKMLCNFQNQTVAVVVAFQRVQNGGQMAVKLNVDDSAMT